MFRLSIFKYQVDAGSHTRNHGIYLSRGEKVIVLLSRVLYLIVRSDARQSRPRAYSSLVPILMGWQLVLAPTLTNSYRLVPTHTDSCLWDVTHIRTWSLLIINAIFIEIVMWMESFFFIEGNGGSELSEKFSYDLLFFVDYVNVSRLLFTY